MGLHTLRGWLTIPAAVYHVIFTPRFPCSGSKGVCLSLSFHHASIRIIFLMLVSPNLATNMRLMPQSVF